MNAEETNYLISVFESELLHCRVVHEPRVQTKLRL